MNRLPHRTAARVASPAPNSAAQAAAIPALVGCLVAAACGCASLPGFSTSAETPPESPSRNLSLTYRTDSGRLNQIATGRKPAQLASFRDAPATPVPQFTTSVLTIEHPHPDGVKGHARVTATFQAKTDGDDDPDTLWRFVAGGQAESNAARPRFREVWQADIRDWQFASLLAHLKDNDYFRRVKVIGCDATIATDINGSRMSKEFPAVDELDALLITIRQHGRRISGNAADAEPQPPALSPGAFPPQPESSAAQSAPDKEAEPEISLID